MSTPVNALYGKVSQSKCQKPKVCGCPACRGLQCLERPRFFYGQLLTEEELNGEQAYQIAKNRLQNRYLHGPGVVCGLEVTCSDCEGQVHVGTGYAIDPCGNDIIVCEETTFDMLDAITKCCERRNRKRDDCDPYQPPPAKGCEELEQTWCVAIEYVEKQARPVTPLKPGKKSCGCGCVGGASCGCGGSSCGCGKVPGQCSCASKNGTTQTSAMTVGSCEPTRIRETYCLSVMEEPEWCKNLLRTWKPQRGEHAEFNAFANLLQLIPEESLLGRVIACWTCAFEILSATVKNDDWAILFQAAEQKLTGQTTPAQVHAALCRLRQAVIDLFAANSHNTRCQMIKVLDSIDCPPPKVDLQIVGNLAGYQAEVAPHIRNLLTMIAQYLIDCICEAFLPPCSPDPMDNRVILACVTVKGGKILRICQFGCRSYAGSFPSLYYWLSAIPVASLIKMGLEWVCCSPDLVRANSPLVNDLYKFIDRLDPGAEKRAGLWENDFAGAKKLLEMAGVWFDNATLKKFRDTIAKGFEGASGLNEFVGKNVGDVRHSLEGQKVAVHVRSVTSEAEMDAPPAAHMSVVREGDQVLAYVKDGKVLGFASYTTEERLRDKEAEIDKTLAEMKALRDELGKHRRG